MATDRFDSVTIARAADTEPMVLAVTLNGEARPEPVYFLRDAKSRLLIDEETLTRWRVRYPVAQRVVEDDRAYIPVDAVSGMTVDINQARQTASITLPGESFVKESVPFVRQATPAPVVPGWGGFFNYNLFAEHAASTTTGSGLLEPGIFGPYGVGTSLVGVNSSTTLGTTQRVVRFDTNWRYDDPQRMTTLIVGDSITQVGSWGQALHFGGIQYGTNFSLQPTFLTFPLQAVSGLATVPSTVDIFINNAKIGEQQVQPGPFTITSIPIVSGAGNVQLVVKDAFGREQVISQSFYSSQALLRQGLSDYGVQAGALRENYGIASNDYSDGFGSGMYRYGFTDRLTGEVRGEAAAKLAAVGVDADYQVGDFGVVSAGAVGSHSDAGSGAKLLAGIQRQTSPWAFAVNGEWNLSGFRELGTVDQPFQPAHQLTLSSSLDISQFGTISGAYATQQYRGARAIDVGVATYSVGLGRLGFLSISATRTIAATSQTGVSVTLTIPLATDTFATVGGQRTTTPAGHTSYASASLQKNLPQTEGYGYRIYGETDRVYQASATVNGPVGTYGVAVAQADGTTAVQANVSGGFGLVEGHLFASRQLTSSFGLVRVGDIEGVEVLSQNQLIDKTNSSGYVVIPQLSAYDQNQISVNPLTIPLNATIDNTRIITVPYLRSGVLIDFPIRQEYVGTFTILLDDGMPAPEGAVVTLEGEPTEFPVGFRGEAFVTGLHEGLNTVAMHWRGASCAFTVQTSPSADPVPDLGSYVCTMVAR